MQARTIFFVVAVLVTLTGCASMQKAGDGPDTQALPFLQVKAAPDSLKGQAVVFGGNVLTGRRLKDGTRIEILQLPLDRSTRPGYDLTQSQGRFIAFQREFLDPATLPPPQFADNASSIETLITDSDTAVVSDPETHTTLLFVSEEISAGSDVP